MKDLIIDAIKEGKKEAIDNVKRELSFEGYDRAADICTTALTEKVDAMYKKINAGEFLSNQEQFLLAQLNELKREIENRLHNASDLSYKGGDDA